MKSESKETITHNKMATMKDWFMDKCKDVNNVLFTLDNIEVNRRLAPMLTQRNIPKFTIPIPNEDSEYTNGMPERGHHGSDGELDRFGNKARGKQNHWSTDNLAGSLPVSPRFARKENVSLKAGKRDRSSSFNGTSHTETCKTCPSSPNRSHPTSPSAYSKSCRTCPTSPCHGAYIDINRDHIKHTNVDPMSTAAMTLEHFKAQTTYGFETLREMPHTRRKESLYFIQDGMDAKGNNKSALSRSYSVKTRTRTPSPKHHEHPSPHSGSASGGNSPTDCMEPPHLFVPIQRRKSSKRRNVHSMVAPLGVVLPDQCGDPIPGIYIILPFLFPFSA